MKQPPLDDLPKEVVGAAINTLLSIGRALEENLDEDNPSTQSILADAAIMAAYVLGDEVADIEERPTWVRREAFREAQAMIRKFAYNSSKAEFTKDRVLTLLRKASAKEKLA